MKEGGLFSIIKLIAPVFFLVSVFVIFSCERGRESVSPSGSSPITPADIVSRTNSPPAITSVRILPENPNKESELSTIIQSEDKDQDPVTYQFQWLKNNEEMPGENQGVLRSGIFKKGDFINVKVTPSDGTAEGKPFISPTVRILNSPPVIQEIWIEPKVAYAKDHLKAQVKCTDIDGDSIYYTYQWEKNGDVLTEERKETLDRSQFKKGDKIAVTAVPDDRESRGVPKKSSPLVISNSPPIIVSSPPTSIEGNIYIYQVRAQDPDNNSILYTLKSGPKGMEIDKETGLIRWVIQREDKKTYSIEIEASDSEGAKSFQRYTFSVEFR